MYRFWIRVLDDVAVVGDGDGDNSSRRVPFAVTTAIRSSSIDKKWMPTIGSLFVDRLSSKTLLSAWLLIERTLTAPDFDPTATQTSAHQTESQTEPNKFREIVVVIVEELVLLLFCVNWNNWYEEVDGNCNIRKLDASNNAVWFFNVSEMSIWKTLVVVVVVDVDWLECSMRK